MSVEVLRTVAQGRVSRANNTMNVPSSRMCNNPEANCATFTDDDLIRTDDIGYIDRELIW